MAAQRQEEQSMLWLRTIVTVLGNDVPNARVSSQQDARLSHHVIHRPSRGYRSVVNREFGHQGFLELGFEHLAFGQHVMCVTEPNVFWVEIEMPGDNIAPDLIRLAPDLTLLCDKPITSPREDIYTDAVEGAWWGLSRKLKNGWQVTYQHEVFAPLRRQITGPTVIPSRKRERE